MTWRDHLRGADGEWGNDMAPTHINGGRGEVVVPVLAAEAEALLPGGWFTPGAKAKALGFKFLRRM